MKQRLRRINVAFIIPIVFLILPFITSCNQMDLILPVIGFDSSGNPAQILLSESEYTNRLTTTVGSIQNSAVSALSNSKGESDWLLRAMVFGVGVNAEIGFGPYKIGAFPELRLIFTNTTDSYVP